MYNMCMTNQPKFPELSSFSKCQRRDYSLYALVDYVIRVSDNLLLKQVLYAQLTQGKQSHGWFGFFVQWHINFHGLFNAKAILVEEQQGYYFTYN